MADNEKILQILPATGWYATYIDDAEGDPLDPVVCFALVEIQQDGMTWQEVKPMGRGHRSIEFIDTTDNFHELVYLPTYAGKA